MNPQKHLSVSPEELSHMRDQTYVWQVDLPADALRDDDMDVLQIEGTLTLKRYLNSVQCIGDLITRVRLISDVTLEPFETDVKVQFQEELEVIADRKLANTLELSLEDAVDQVTEEEPINLFELLRQYLILSLPMQKTDPENCYNEELTKYLPGSRALIDPTWEAIRQKVESWEPPSEN